VPQKIEIAYGSFLISESINSRLTDILGRNGIMRGYRVTPGAGRSVTLSPGLDSESVLFIRGTKIQDSDVIPDIPISANATGVTRTDILYAYYEHGVSSSCSYQILTGGGVIPQSSLTAKIAEIDVPPGATTILQSNIRQEPVVFSINELQELLRSVSSALAILQSSFNAHTNLSLAHGATSIATPNSIMARDASGRAKAAAPSAADDIARLDTVSSAVNTHSQALTHPATDKASTWAATQTMNTEVNLNQIHGRLVVPVWINRYAVI